MAVYSFEGMVARGSLTVAQRGDSIVEGDGFGLAVAELNLELGSGFRLSGKFIANTMEMTYHENPSKLWTTEQLRKHTISVLHDWLAERGETVAAAKIMKAFIEE